MTQLSLLQWRINSDKQYLPPITLNGKIKFAFVIVIVSVGITVDVFVAAFKYVSVVA